MSDRMTAMDVERQEFAAKMRGYDRDEVRMFLRSVAEEIGRLHLENGALREELGRAREALDDLRARERTLQDTLVTAQSMVADIKERSHREAELLVKEARIKSERVLEQAQDQMDAIEAEMGRARLERDAFENRLRSAIEEHLALLDLRKKERVQTERDNVLVLRRRSGAEAG